MFSLTRTPLKHVLAILDYKFLNAYPNHHLPNKYANIILDDFAWTAPFKAFEKRRGEKGVAESSYDEG